MTAELSISYAATMLAKGATPLVRVLGRVLASTLVVASCSSLGGLPDGRQAAEELVKTGSNGLITLLGFTKTNGQQRTVFEVKMYALEYEAEIEFNGDACYGSIASDAPFAANAPMPNGSCGFLAFDKVRATKGDRLRVKGEMNFEMTEKGWRLSGIQGQPIHAENMNIQGQSTATTVPPESTGGTRSQTGAVVATGAGASGHDDADFTGAAVWKPSDTQLDELTDACRTAAAGSKCIPAYMRKSGATPEAITFAEFVASQGGYLSEFEEDGEVDIATITYPQRANENEECVLLNGSPRIVFTSEHVDRINLRQDPTFLALTRKFQKLILWPGHATFVRKDTTSRQGPRFVFSYVLLNGCHACDIGGHAEIAFDFDTGSQFQGARLLRIVPEGQAAAPTAPQVAGGLAAATQLPPTPHAPSGPNKHVSDSASTAGGRVDRKTDSAPPAAIPGEGTLIGSWEGTVSQPDAGEAYPTTMTIDSLVGPVAGTIEYPTLDCGGAISFIGIGSDGLYTFRERIREPGQCVDGGSIEVQASSRDVLRWRWRYPDGRVGASATLQRRPRRP